MRLLPVLLAFTAVPAWAQNWQIGVDSLACEGAVMTIGARIRYVGAKAPVESPVVRLASAEGAARLPRSLVWKSGSKGLAALLVAGGVRGLDAGEAVHIELRFELGDAAGPVRLEFADLPAFALTRKGTPCRNLVKSPGVPAPQARQDAAKPPASLRVYRNAFPCGRAPAALKTVEADHPPHLPKQLIVLGRGYLPGIRHVDLPMGRAPARTYLYTGPDTLDAIEQAARRAITADFPQYAAGGYFAFNWGEQRGATGNQIDSIGLYELRPCPQLKKGARRRPFSWSEAA